MNRLLFVLAILAAVAAANESATEDAVGSYLAQLDSEELVASLNPSPRLLAYVPGGDLGNAPDYTKGSATATETKKAEERWTSFLPIGGKKVREKGYELPLPFGASLSMMYLKRDIKVTSIKAGVDGEPLQDVDFLQVTADSKVNNVMFRLDSWILPFFNVYGMFGWTKNRSVSTLSFTIPTPGPGGGQDVTVDLPSTLDGPTYGLGITLAGGWRNYFITGDVNYSVTDLQVFSSEIKVLIASVRTGWFGQIGNLKIRFWTGAVYWDTARTIEGVVDVPGVGEVRYEVEQGPVTDWTIILGTNMEITDQFTLVVEAQFLDDVRMILGSMTYRF